MKIPPPQTTIAALIDEAHEKRQERPRSHMGCSQLGHHCERLLWLSFRWSVVEQFSGRMLRLFRRGHMEEDTIVSDLRAIGVDIQSTGGSQSRVDFGSHVSGSIDGIIERGVPGAEKTRHILEAKTHSKKSFDDLVKKASVKEAKPVHWAQCQVYMYGKGIERALYYAVCKDDDRIYTERVRLDKDAAKALVERGQRIALTDRMPEPCPGASPDWYQCKFCPAHSFCHDHHTTEHVNCRTCAHSTAMKDSTWHCARWDAAIPTDAQHEGCPSHVLHPDLVPWKRAESDNEWQAVYIVGETKVKNGEGPDAYESKELLSNMDACLSDDKNIDEIRKSMGGRIEG